MTFDMRLGGGPRSLRPVVIDAPDRSVRDVLPDVVGQVPVGVAVLRRDRTIAYHNDEFARITGITTAPVSSTGDPPAAAPAILPPLLPDGEPSFPDGIDPVDQVLGSGRPVAGRRVLVPVPDAPAAPAVLGATPIIAAGQRVSGAVVYLEERTAAGEASLREAFVGALSHELRTPITGIYGGALLLLEDRVPAGARAALLADIAAGAEEVARLVDDLLALAELGQGTVAQGNRPALLHHLAVTAARAEERRWPGRRVEVQAEADLPAVCGDDAHLTQVLRNLISNAIRYSPPDAPVLVTVSADERAVHLAVLDRGPGFPPGIGDDAFRLFHRRPADATRSAGTGMGLYVARSLVEALGGTIWMRERPGGGTEIGVDLPRYGHDQPDP